MKIAYAKKTFFLAIFNLLVLVAGAQTITIGSVDAGPYGQGSTISVPIKLDNNAGCFTTSNTFNLYLSDASGNFGAQTKIGSISGFYVTFVNGIIPATTPAGSQYKVRVVSTAPVVTSSESTAFTVNASAGVVAGTSSQVLNQNYPEVFGTCFGDGNKPYTFLNQSTSDAAVTASFYNDLASGASEGTFTFSPSAVFTARAANYTVTVKATKGGITGTKSYLLINNVLNNSFGSTGNPVVCLKDGGNLTYNIDITSPTGIQNNYPGLIYNVNWGDGAKSSFTICDLIALKGQITHKYTASSCGSVVNKIQNVFGVDFQSQSTYCGNSNPLTSYAKVLAPPINKFAEVPAACVNTPVTFANTSYPGQSANSPAQDCVNPNAKYDWYVDDNPTPIAKGYGATQPFVYTFTTNGVHKVRLVLEPIDGLCGAGDVTNEICIQNPPKPVFTLPAATDCLPLTAPVIPENTSVIDNNCNTSNAYLWITAGPAKVTYADGTSENSEKPHFIFTKAGVYRVNLIINTASCGQVLGTERQITVDEQPTAQLSADGSVCGIGQTLKFNTDPGITHTVLTGIGELKPDSYTWTVSGGAYEFTGGTTANTQYPQILFKDAATYTITVVVKNSCGNPVTATQQLKFQESPILSVTAPPLICADAANIPVTGVVQSGTITGQKWTSSGTGKFTDDSQLITTYTPSAADIAAGKVTLVLTGNTVLPAPCDKVVNSVTVTIEPQNTITSSPSIPACSGTAFNYTITASKANSTFTWTVDQANTSASASGYALSGSGTVIKDIITNADEKNEAIVTYIIQAVGGNCNGNSFTLTVHVGPKQTVASFTQDKTEGCGDLTVQFTNTSIPLNSTFSWSFGDGSSSTDVSPQHIFKADPTDGKDITYRTTLQLYNACGDKQTLPVDILVRPAIPIARIAPRQLSGCSPFTLTVDNQSPGTNKSYTYYVYDGSNLVDTKVLTDKSAYTVDLNPTVTKIYTLYMVAEGFCNNFGESFHLNITVSPPQFSAITQIEGDNKGCVPFTATFFNKSTGGEKFLYKIYDKNGNFLKQVDASQPGTSQPIAFDTPGTYYVSIAAANSCTPNSIESDKFQNEVTVYPLPIPGFSADVTTGCKSLLVNFTNTTQAPDANSQAAAYSYDWDFGDGSPHAFVQNPAAHLYKYGNLPYTVTLVVTNPVTQCTATITKNGFITVTAPPFTAFTVKPDSVINIPNYRFSFVDQTTGGPTSWKWDLGDGSTSTNQNPEHTYRDTGLYTVTLTTLKNGCDSTISHKVRITGIPGQLYLPNAFMPTSGTTELQKFIAKGSGIKTWHLQIFNNYGQLMWETTKLAEPKGTPVYGDGWDGTFRGAPVQQGVYIWQASATFINGTEWKGMSYNNSLPKRTGTINLIR
jgi:PKD repeat protein